MLNITADAEVKRRIAQHFLDLCGHPHRVGSDRFMALVRDGRAELLEEGTKNDTWQVIEGFSTVCSKAFCEDQNR